MEPKTEKKSFTGIFSWIIIIFTVLIMWKLWSSGLIISEAISANVAGILVKIAIWLFAVKGLEFFQRGIGTKLEDEIYDEANTAAAIYEVGIKIGLAIVIAGASL